jgi:DNA (cytosine-5)-methyltransferase 1
MLDLFTGIGGFSLAASWVWGEELDLAGFCEQDAYCGKVLKKNFPDVPIYPDIKELRGEWFQDIDLITGGFPCQDISVAGKGAGIDGKRSGLWTEMCRLIGEVRPRYALIENVPMLIHRGLERVLCDLAEIGYDAEWQVIGADDVGARHKRKRIWIVAHTQSEGRECGSTGKQGIDSQCRTGLSGRHDTGTVAEEGETVAYPVSTGLERRGASGGKNSGRELASSERRQTPIDVGHPSSNPQAVAHADTETVPDTNTTGLGGSEETGNLEIQRTQRHQFVTGSCATGNIWTVEPDVGRVANGVPKRVDRLRGLGNAIVPQVAALIMQMIKDDI